MRLRLDWSDADDPESGVRVVCCDCSRDAATRQLAGPAVAALALHALVDGPPREGLVAGAGPRAAYLTFSPSALDVVALVRPDAVLLPIAVQVHDLPPLSQGDRAAVGAGELSVGDCTWRIARWWDPVPHVRASALLAQSDRLVRFVAAMTAERLGVDVDAAVGAARGVATGDPSPALAILGGGPGFTPAGDDVVAGSLAALALVGALDDDVRHAVLAAAADHTTAVSAALLASAARGEVLPQAASLVHALAIGAHDDVLGGAATTLCGVGATSGTALLFGMAHALALAAPVAANAAQITKTETETR